MRITELSANQTVNNVQQCSTKSIHNHVLHFENALTFDFHKKKIPFLLAAIWLMRHYFGRWCWWWWDSPSDYFLIIWLFSLLFLSSILVFSCCCCDYLAAVKLVFYSIWCVFFVIFDFYSLHSFFVFKILSIKPLHRHIKITLGLLEVGQWHILWVFYFTFYGILVDSSFFLELLFSVKFIL